MVPWWQAAFPRGSSLFEEALPTSSSVLSRRLASLALRGWLLCIPSALCCPLAALVPALPLGSWEQGVALLWKTEGCYAFSLRWQSWGLVYVRLQTPDSASLLCQLLGAHVPAWCAVALRWPSILVGLGLRSVVGGGTVVTLREE